MLTPVIGFVGLGIMGHPMARNLIKAGYPLVVHNRSREAVQALVKLGASEAWSAREVAQKAEIIITVLPDSPDVESVALGPDGLVHGIGEGAVYVDMSTIAPSVAIRVALVMSEKRVRCLDAPVSGGEAGAINGTLSIMVGGDVETLDAVLPVLQTMGSTITWCGPHGAGQIVKACNQVQVALNIVGMAEALVFGAKQGVDPAIVVKVLSAGYAQSRVMDARGERVIRGDFRPGFRSRLHLKDLNIALQSATECRTPLPATAAAHELFTAMLAAGRGDLDHTGVITVLEDLAQSEARTKPQSQKAV
jgi:2-hydroxy-3-oxopropionate reductase